MRRPVTIVSLLLASCFLLLASAPPVLAQVANGDFEAGGAGWTPVVPANWSVTFPVAGGNPNGHALLRSPFGNSGGEAIISQTFTCGSDLYGTCFISVDYFLDSIDAGPLTGRVRITLDGAPVYVSPAADEIA